MRLPAATAERMTPSAVPSFGAACSKQACATGSLEPADVAQGFNVGLVGLVPAMLLKEAGLLQPARGDQPARLALNVVPLFETIGDLRAAPGIIEVIALRG